MEKSKQKSYPRLFVSILLVCSRNKPTLGGELTVSHNKMVQKTKPIWSRFVQEK